MAAGVLGEPDLDLPRLASRPAHRRQVQELFSHGSLLRSQPSRIAGAQRPVESVRVLSSCNVRKLDELAVQAVENAARRLAGTYPGKRTVTTWAVQSAYAANIPIGASIDETGLGRKNARGIGKYLSSPEYVVGGEIQTKVTLLSLREPPE